MYHVAHVFELGLAKLLHAWVVRDLDGPELAAANRLADGEDVGDVGVGLGNVLEERGQLLIVVVVEQAVLVAAKKIFFIFILLVFIYIEIRQRDKEEKKNTHLALTSSCQ